MAIKDFFGLGDSPFPKIRDLQSFNNAKDAVKRLQEIYKTNSNIILHTFEKLLGGEINAADLPNLEGATYPYIGLKVDSSHLDLDARHSYGVAVEAGTYGGTVTRPDIFASYYEEQISLLLERHKVPVYVGISNWPIPLPFTLEDGVSNDRSVSLDMSTFWQKPFGFVLPNLTRINDDVANCTNITGPEDIKPISIFSGERVDYSLHRLHHYTGTTPDHFQGFMLLTNYHRYVKEFIVYALEALATQSEYTELILPGNIVCKSLADVPEDMALPQMPAYHLKRADGQGITFVNMGVGPTNAKNITDHLAVLRPHCWIMLGHCAGLRSSQVLGDYILPHGYVREDHVLDQDLPVWVPVPPIAEVQLALYEAVANISHEKGLEMKSRMRTGTVVTTDNRNWELRSSDLYERFKQSRAVALDMESATVAANGFRFRVPYGALLCVSDKPIHGEIKLRNMANEFYAQRVSQHLEIGIEAVRLLRAQGVDQLHSRKLRGFDEPPFR